MEEEIHYSSTDNIILYGLFSQVNDTNEIVILCHGLKANRTERGSFDHLVEALRVNDINSFRFDFRGHGESSGKDFEMTVSGEKEDLESTIKMLSKKGFEKIVVLGASFGASIMSFVDYKKYNNVLGLISWYGALDYFGTIEEDSFFSEEHKKIAERNGYFEIKSKRTGKSFRLGKDLYKEIYSLTPYKELVKVDLPVLFVHGLEDQMVPYDLSVKISKECKNSQLVLIENGDHTFDNDSKALSDAIDASINFIKTVFK